jgi:hypothetical protein
MRRAILLAAVLALASVAQGEVHFNSLSVTATSQTLFFAAPRSGVMLCSYGANIAYYRIFEENDTPAAATTANIPIPAGSATAPVCKSYSKPPTAASFPKAVSIVCNTAETATVTLESW